MFLNVDSCVFVCLCVLFCVRVFQCILPVCLCVCALGGFVSLCLQVRACVQLCLTACVWWFLSGFVCF